jgi:hypothetical protein
MAQRREEQPARSEKSSPIAPHKHNLPSPVSSKARYDLTKIWESMRSGVG